MTRGWERLLHARLFGCQEEVPLFGPVCEKPSGVVCPTPRGCCLILICSFGAEGLSEWGPPPTALLEGALKICKKKKY